MSKNGALALACPSISAFRCQMDSWSIRDELRRLAIAFEKAGVPYALCGGLAVGVHGYPRATKDIDFLVLSSDLDAAKVVARECGFTLDTGCIPIGFQSGVKRVIYRLSKIVNEDAIMVDFILIDEPDSNIWTTREQFDWEGISLWVVSRESLIQLKQEADRHIDHADIENLCHDDES
jgi:hypothetical protein